MTLNYYNGLKNLKINKKCMTISFKYYKETEVLKARADIFLNKKYIGYYVQHEDGITYEITLDGSHYVEDCESEEELKEQIKYYYESNND